MNALTLSLSLIRNYWFFRHLIRRTPESETADTDEDDSVGIFVCHMHTTNFSVHKFRSELMEDQPTRCTIKMKI